jgi:hypothetical protein
MRAVLVALVAALAVPALAQTEAVPKLSVRRADPSTTGLHPFQLDAALRPAFAEEAVAAEPSLVLVPEYDAEVTVSVKGEQDVAGFHVTFDLATTRPPLLKDHVVVDLQRAEVGVNTARAMVRTVVLRARALLEQAQVAAAEGSLVPTAPEPPIDGRPGPFKLKPPPPREWSRFDVSVVGGLNTPAGFVGGRVVLNPFGYIGLSFAAGYSSWGPRVAPGVRVYPFGLDLLGLYAELDAFISLGEGATVTVAGESVPVQLKSTLSVAPMLGYRQQLLKWLVADVFLGWGFRLASANVARDDGGAVERALLNAVDGRQPQGFIAGVAVGASFF